MGTERAYHIWGGARLCAQGERPQKSQLHKTRREENLAASVLGVTECLQLPDGGRRICVAGPLGDHSKGRQVFFPKPSSETWLGDTQATQES